LGRSRTIFWAASGTQAAVASFSTVTGERGASERDIRGFAMKSSTDQGNGD
jgi:catalase